MAKILSTFSVRASTIIPVATSAVVPLMAAGGQTLAVRLRAVTSWLRTCRTSSLRLAITVATVLPSAV